MFGKEEPTASTNEDDDTEVIINLDEVKQLTESVKDSSRFKEMARLF